MAIFRAVALLVLVAAFAVANDYAAPADERSVRSSAETLVSLSDEDYRDIIATSKVETVRDSTRASMLGRIFRSLAAPRRNKAAQLDPALTAAGRTVGDDQKSAGIDAELVQQTGWWAETSSAVNQALNQRSQVRNVTAVAGVRGGRKLSTDSDKEIYRILDAVDAGDAALADAAMTPRKAAQIHLEAARSYEKIAGIVAEPAPTQRETAPVAAAPAVLSAKELYQKASPSVVLIMAADSGGAGELGTGSVIDARGRVLTNAHVVINDKTGKPFGTIRVYLKPAKVTGDTKRDVRDPVAATVSRYDRALDLAILEPERPLGAAALMLGDDSAVEPGDPVIAIGHPEQGGLWTLTQGVVSAAIADLGGVAGKNAFQTDASINRGNSGGPLIDRTGAIVGVNTSMARKAADGLTITSVNFSVRSSVAKRWLDATGPSTVASVPGAQRPGLGGEAAPVAAAPATPAPVAALPPAPKTKPQILTPAQPYRIEDAIEEGMKEMEDLEDEMKAEIELRRRALQQKQAAER